MLAALSAQKNIERAYISIKTTWHWIPKGNRGDQGQGIKVELIRKMFIRGNRSFLQNVKINFHTKVVTY